MKTLLLLLTFFLAKINYSQDDFGAVLGTVWSETNEESEPFVDVTLRNKSNSYTAISDINGMFTINNVVPGEYQMYSVELSDTIYTNKIQVIAGRNTYLTHILPKKPEIIVCYLAPKYLVPEIPDLYRKEILQNVNRFQLPVMISGMTSDARFSNENQIRFQGARTNENLQLIDGVKTLNFTTVPASSMKSVRIYEGFVPANYGDTNGGVVVIETLGYFDLYLSRFPQD